MTPAMLYFTCLPMYAGNMSLYMRRLSAILACLHDAYKKFVTRLLTNEQKQYTVQVLQELLEMANGDKNFLKCAITGDDPWF